MKLKNTNVLILGLLIAVSACGKHPLTKTNESDSTAQDPAKAAAAAGKAAEAIKAAKDAAAKKKLEDLNKTFRVIPASVSTELSKLFVALQTIGDKVKAMDVSVNIKLDKEKPGTIIVVVGTFDVKNQVLINQPLVGQAKSLETSIVEYNKDKKTAISTAHSLKIGDQVAIENGAVKAALSAALAGGAITLVPDNVEIKLPILKAELEDMKKITNLVLDSSRDVVADPIDVDVSGLGEGSECAVVVTANKDSKTTPTGLILTNLIKDGKVNFSSVKKDELATVISDGKPVDAYFVCANFQKAPTENKTQLLFTQRAIKLTIKAAPAAPAAPATPKS